MRAKGIGAVLLALGMLVLWTVSASAQYDVKRGEFLTDVEYAKMKAVDAMAYCTALSDELAARQKELADLKMQADANRSRSTQLRTQLKSLNDKIADLKNKVAMMEREYGPYRNKEFQHAVVKGECLSIIAAYDRVYGDKMKWPRLYRANRDQITDPNLIYPKQMLKVPQGYPKWHMVIEGEFLSKIANYWEIYNSGKEWPRIYEANKDQIRDPDLIYPDQVLTIPR
jgi:nucleoid-associated protein YgaU